MPRVEQHHEIHTLYSPAHRKVTFPHADWSFLIRAARNCAVAFDVIHGCGHVIGDVNQGGILVSKQATIKLIDCDSFQVRHGGRLFPCDVGVPHFTPPELQGKSFKGLHRTEDHDRFGLAILVFHLLFMGRHPFVGRFQGKGDMPIEQAIVEGRFAFSQNAARMQMMPPPFALRLRDASAEIAALFERAFRLRANGRPGRPAAAEWARGLDALEHSLSRCAEYAAHTFHASLSTCPWCQIEQNGGPDLFIALTAAVKLGGKFDLDKVWAAISAIQLPTPPAIAGAVATKGSPLTRRQLVWANATAAMAIVALMLLIAACVDPVCRRRRGWCRCHLAGGPQLVAVFAREAAQAERASQRSRRRRAARRRNKLRGRKVDTCLRGATGAARARQSRFRAAVESIGQGRRSTEESAEREPAEGPSPAALHRQGKNSRHRPRPGRRSSVLRRRDRARYQPVDSRSRIRAHASKALLAWRAAVKNKFRFDRPGALIPPS